MVSAAGEGLFSFQVVQQRTLKRPVMMKMRMCTPKPVAIAFSFESPTSRNPAAQLQSR